MERQQELLESEEEYREEIRPLYNDIYNKIKEFDEETLEHNYEKYKETKEYLSKIQHDIK